MKKMLAFLLTMTMLLGLCACGGKPSIDNSIPVGDDTTTSTTEGTGTTTLGDESASTDGTTDGTATSTDGTTGSTKAPTSGTSTSTKAPTKTPTNSTTASTKTPTKTPTKMPTATKPTTQSAGDEKAIRVLAIGDNYAVDAMEKYLYDLLKGAGYDKVHLGILYADKSTLDTHYNAVKNDTKTYEFRQNTAGKWEKQTNVAPSAAFKAAKWDYVVLQQAGADAGIENTYGKLDDLTTLVQNQCADAALYWHMSWSFRRQSEVPGFEKYKYNTRKMYEAIIENAIRKVMPIGDMMGFVPSATAIQNLRTSVLRDELTTDGVRLSDYGAYAVALTWYGLLTGESAKDVAYRPAAVKDHFAEIAEAADNALFMPSAVTPATAGEGEVKDLRILAFGHSFAQDAMVTYMWDAFEAAGYDVTIAYLYYPGGSLEQHWHYVSDNSASYEMYAKNADGNWKGKTYVDAKTALWDEDWDIITFQPDPDYGYDKHPGDIVCEWGCDKVIESDYIHFNQLVDKVLSILADPANPNGANTDVKLYYHLTWSWRKDCYLGQMMYPYPQKYSQLTLYQDHIEATRNKVLTNDKIQGVIPCNTAIENVRTSWMGDTFNAEGHNDGFHLNDKGDLVAALTWVSYFTGAKASKILVDNPYSDAEFAAIAEAVDNAIANQWQVTQSSYKTKP